MSEAVNLKIDQACDVAEEFTKIFYDAIDTQRHLLSRLYLDEGVLVWNGNGIKGNEWIQKYLTELPPSDHTVATFDAHPILDFIIPCQTTITINVSGSVRYNDSSPAAFTQHFLLTADNNKWKIVSDTFRVEDIELLD